MIYPILKMGDARLLRVAEPVLETNTPQLHQLVNDMFATMAEANGAGLAAPQIGVNLQLVIFGFKDNARYPDAPTVPETVLINPVLTPLSEDMEEAWEGCLSVPGMRGLVPRWTKLRYEGVDQFGKKICREVDGFHARVVQHECDHLNGVLYPMRIRDLAQFGYTEVLFPQMDPNEDD
ncbi:peptide deformylase [Undibacterium piscinae]|uniref:Peptide deformylase n=1 Tax=Undibacterium piscinae TaxID=2495591 RepID=A0A6M4A308_9BURK|nr:peptide deformylase [Undibacterium piscinae]